MYTAHIMYKSRSCIVEAVHLNYIELNCFNTQKPDITFIMVVYGNLCLRSVRIYCPKYNNYKIICGPVRKKFSSCRVTETICLIIH